MELILRTRLWWPLTKKKRRSKQTAERGTAHEIACGKEKHQNNASNMAGSDLSVYDGSRWIEHIDMTFYKICSAVQ